MPILTRLIGLHLLILVLVGSIVLGGKTDIYFDIPNLVFVLGLLVGGALLCFPFAQLRDAIKAVSKFESSPAPTAWQRQQRIAVFARLYQLAWGGGLVGALISLIAMLSDLSDMASIGAGMAYALLAPAYGALLAEFIFNPMQQIVMNQKPSGDPGSGDEKAADTPTPVPAPGQSAIFKGVAVITVIVTMFLVPVLSFSQIQKEDNSGHTVEEIQEAFDLRSEPADDNDAAHSLIEQLEDNRARTDGVSDVSEK